MHDDEPADPRRLADEADAPPSLRALLEARDELTPPPLPDAVRSDTRHALITATQSEREPASLPWRFAAVAFAMAAIALLAWLVRSDETPGPALPPLVGETDAALPLEPTHDASSPDASTSDAGPPEPREDVPWLEIHGNGCGLDVRLSLSELDDDVTSVALVLDEVSAAPERGLVDTDCEGTIVRELDAELFRRAASVPSELSLPLSLGAPEVRCGGTYTVTVCLRDELGRLATTRPPSAQPVRTRDAEENRFVGRIETPSGPASPSDLIVGHVVTGFFFRTSPPWTTPGPRTPSFVEARVLRAVSIPSEHDAESNRETTLELDGARAISVPADTRVATSQRGYVPASTIAIGEAVLVLDRGEVHARRVQEVSTIDHAASAAEPHPWPVHRMLDVSFPDAYFVDGLLVHDVGVEDEPEPPSLVPVSWTGEPIRAMPEPSWDCSLSSELVVESLPETARAIAIVYAPHRGRGGARRALSCDEHLGLELPRALLDVIPPGPDGARVLSARVPGWDDEMDEWYAVPARDDDVEVPRPTPASVRCDSAYDVLACVRAADGSLTSLPGAEGRWTRTGPACFARGTEITTARGLAAIETLTARDHVTSRDPRTGEVREVRVHALIPRGNRAIRAITLASGHVLRVTDEHPLLDAETSVFRVAESFVVGDRLLDVEGHPIEIVAIARAGSTTVFDLSVDAPHTFVAEGVVVHNY
ncbi:MAG: Hint domain-containing protein [Sandaracinus sp.]